MSDDISKRGLLVIDDLIDAAAVWADKMATPHSECRPEARAELTKRTNEVIAYVASLEGILATVRRAAKDNDEGYPNFGSINEALWAFDDENAR